MPLVGVLSTDVVGSYVQDEVFRWDGDGGVQKGAHSRHAQTRAARQDSRQR